MTATKLKEKPILFSTPLVIAILENHKTQTRRLMKPQPVLTPATQTAVDQSDKWLWGKRGWFVNAPGLKYECPYGQVDDCLWVREKWCQTEDGYDYFADKIMSWSSTSGKWKPSIHMPRAVSRITLQIIDIRVEQLQSISEQDSIAEGIKPHPVQSNKWFNYNGCVPDYFDNARLSFESLWKSINGADSWKMNPWCWVVDFKKIDNK